MESLANAMEKLIRRVLVQSGKCPECSEPLYSWRAKNKDGSERCKPTCMSCGYKALRVKEDIQTERIYNDSLKARALSFFQAFLSSVISFTPPVRSVSLLINSPILGLTSAAA